MYVKDHRVADTATFRGPASAPSSSLRVGPIDLGMIPSLRRRNRIRLGVIANEFFDPGKSRLGGFGMLTRQIARCAERMHDPVVEVDFYWGDPPEQCRSGTHRVYGRPLHVMTGQWRRQKLGLMLRRPDMFLSIDWRSNYLYFLSMFKNVPLIMWVQDPRTPEDWQRCFSTALPGQAAAEPMAGLGYIDCTDMADFARARDGTKGQAIFASPSPFLNAKIASTYNARPGIIHTLPYPMEPVTRRGGEKAERPTVLFLGRLDPQKRPWLIPMIAERLPHVRFAVLGKRQVKTGIAWEPSDLPANVELLGHLDGEEKTRELAASWVLLNTSIHEGLPVSFVEALQHETPIVSCVDPEGVTSRFGIHVPLEAGSGAGSADAFAAAIEALVQDEPRRRGLGREGRIWAEVEHSQMAFMQGLRGCLTAVR